MTEVKLYCDRCKKEITKEEYYRLETPKNIDKFNNCRCEDIEFCPDCYFKFINVFMANLDNSDDVLINPDLYSRR